MKDTALISIEIGKACNLAKIHTRCPSADVDRYGNLDTSKPISTTQIIDLVVHAYKEMGFTGKVAFHYYNEPLLFADRVNFVIDEVRKIHPEAKFFLNTNGNYIRDNLDLVKKFNQITLSNYDNEDWTWLKEELGPDIWLWVWDIFTLDPRKSNFSGGPDNRMCKRPYKEIIIDFYGNAHLCCMDWKGNIKLGNVHQDKFEDIVEKFIDIRKKVSSDPMSDDAPDLCKVCRLKSTNPNV